MSLFNGSMQVSSGPGSSQHGSVWADLRGNNQRHGRWETRIAHLKSGHASFRVDLVPRSASGATCSPHTITLFEVVEGQSRPYVGVTNARGRQWRRQVPVHAQDFHAYAVVVRPHVIRWLVDGKVVGKVTKPGAFTREALTVRVSHHNRHDSTVSSRTLIDWVRAWPLTSGQRKATGGRELRATGGAPVCR